LVNHFDSFLIIKISNQTHYDLPDVLHETIKNENNLDIIWKYNINK